MTQAVITALEELGDFFGPGRSKSALFFLITAVIDKSWVQAKPIEDIVIEFQKPTEYVGLDENEPLVRMPLRIHKGLLEELDVVAKHLGWTRSAVIRKILTKAVDERIKERHPCLKITLQKFKLERELWPWEKSPQPK